VPSTTFPSKAHNQINTWQQELHNPSVLQFKRNLEIINTVKQVRKWQPQKKVIYLGITKDGTLTNTTYFFLFKLISLLKWLSQLYIS